MKEWQKLWKDQAYEEEIFFRHPVYNAQFNRSWILSLFFITLLAHHLIHNCVFLTGEAFGDLLKSKNIPVRAPFLRLNWSGHPVVYTHL